MEHEDIEIVDFGDMDLTDAIVIAGFPSIGLVSTIAANYLIDALDLQQIGSVNSSHFPALSVVHTREPLSPVRIYAGTIKDGNKVVVFVSEFKPKPHLINAITDAIMDWVKEKNCKTLISPEGMVVEKKGKKSDKKSKSEEFKKKSASDAYAIASTDNSRSILLQKSIPQFKNGIIAGVSGVLLNRGKQSDFDVISILAEAHPNYPDAKAAAAAINVMASIIDMDINVTPLYEESERIEKKLQKFHKQAKPMVSSGGKAPQPSMYG